jgi:hypothetical protein
LDRRFLFEQRQFCRTTRHFRKKVNLFGKDQCFRRRPIFSKSRVFFLMAHLLMNLASLENPGLPMEIDLISHIFYRFPEIPMFATRLRLVEKAECLREVPVFHNNALLRSENRANQCLCFCTIGNCPVLKQGHGIGFPRAVPYRRKEGRRQPPARRVVEMGRCYKKGANRRRRWDGLVNAKDG